MTSPSIPPSPFSLPTILPPPVPPAFKPILPKPITFSDKLIAAEGVEALNKAIALLGSMQATIDSTFVRISTEESHTLSVILQNLMERSARLLDTLVVTTIVIAGNHGEFVHWCTARRRDPRELIYISNADQILGYKFVRVECVGTWFERRDILEIMRALGTVNQV